MNLEDVVIDPVMSTRYGRVTREIPASAEAVARLVTDIGSMPRWSPECVRCEWLDGATRPVIGARFRGWNRRGFARWSTISTVVAHQPGRRFVFDTGYTRWSYQFEPRTDSSCLVIEEYQAYKRHRLSEMTRWMQRVPDLDAHLCAGMATTLERLAAAATAAAG